MLITTKIVFLSVDSGFHAADSGFQALDFSLFQWNLDCGYQSLVGFQNPRAVFQIRKPRILTPQAKFSPILESFTDMG